MGYTLSLYAYDLALARLTLNSALPQESDDQRETMLARFDRILDDGAVALGDLGYSSHSGDPFRTWLQDIAETADVDLTKLEFLEALNPAGSDLDFPAHGGLTRSEINLAVERLAAMEEAGNLDDTSQELLILLERAQQLQSDIVTQLS